VVVSVIPEPEIVQGAGHSHGGKSDNKKSTTAKSKAPAHKDEKYLLNLGFVTAVGISLHNFPEGIAVYLACIKGLSIGLPLTFAIAAHNIPEGMAVATPIYHATGSKWLAFKYSMLSGACEPVGALVVAFFFNDMLDEHLVHCLLAAGMLLFHMVMCNNQATHVLIGVTIHSCWNHGLDFDSRVDASNIQVHFC
jgi:zinc transporter, ZIP family